jgi:hypothetical protein
VVANNLDRGRPLVVGEVLQVTRKPHKRDGVRLVEVVDTAGSEYMMHWVQLQRLCVLAGVEKEHG